MQEEIGAAYKLNLVAFPPRLTAPDYLKINSLGTVPLLLDGETRLTESGAILQYLAVKYGPPVLRVEPDDADYGAWLNWLHVGEATLTAPQTVALRYGLFEPEARRLPGVVEDYVQVFLDKLIGLEAVLKTSDYVCAERFTAADICVGYALMLAPYIGAHERMPASVRSVQASKPPSPPRLRRPLKRFFPPYPCRWSDGSSPPSGSIPRLRAGRGLTRSCRRWLDSRRRRW
jgi:glutathione S-transferase